MTDDDEPVMYRTVDLEIRSKVSLAPFVQAFGDEPQHQGPELEYELTTYASRSAHRDQPWKYGGDAHAEEDIRGFCGMIEKLPREALKAWRAAKSRRFDLCIDGSWKGRHLQLCLKTDTLQRVAALRAEIALTVHAATLAPPDAVNEDGSEIDPWDKPHFCNLDLEVLSKAPLLPIVDAWGEDVSCLYNGPRDPDLQLAAFEVFKSHFYSADGKARSFCRLVKSLPPDAMKLWQEAESRRFDIGIDCGRIGPPLALLLKATTVAMVAEVAGELVVTVYPYRGPNLAQTIAEANL